MNEQEIIALSLQGDLEPFNQLVEQYQGQVYSLAFRMLGSRAAADDATQEAFISAFKNLRSYRGGSFRAWLLRIATNACYDQLRLLQRRPSTSLDAMLEDPNWQPSSSELSPEEQAENAELAREIGSAMATLPPDQRAVLILVDVEGYSYEEVAEITSSSMGTVKSRLSRARARMREFLLTHGEQLPSRFRLESRGM